MTKDEALRLALEALENLGNHDHVCPQWPTYAEPENYPKCNCGYDQAITAIKAALEAKDEPYAFEASMYPRVIIDPVTGNVSIGTVKKPCGLECDCTDVCKQDDYKALWQQMCERCDELDKKLAQQEHGWTPERIAGMARLKAQQDKRLEPQRTWVGLDVEDYIKALELCDFNKDTAFDFFEAKLKELNT